jgi:hypothetical protein
MKRLLLMPRAEVTLVELADELSDRFRSGTESFPFSPEPNERTLALKTNPKSAGLPLRNNHREMGSSDVDNDESLTLFDLIARIRSKPIQISEKINIKKPGLLDSSAATQKKEKAVTPKQVESSSDKKTTSLTSENPHKTDEYELRQVTEKNDAQNPYTGVLDAAQKAVDVLSRHTTPKQAKSVSAPTTEKETTINPWLVDPDDLIEQAENKEVGADPAEEFVIVNPNETTCPVPSNLAPKKPDPDGSMLPFAASSSRSTPAPDQLMPSPASSPPTSPILYRHIAPLAIEKAWHELAEAPQTQGRDDPVFDDAVEKMAATVKFAWQQGNAEIPSPQVAQVSVDASYGGSLQELPSTDAVKQNWEKEVWQPKERVPTPKRRTLPEFFGERTRSCATVDLCIPQTSVSVKRKGGPSHAISPLKNDGDYDAYILQTTYAGKRVKVLQLFIFGTAKPF